jgi:hypothetical protein
MAVIRPSASLAGSPPVPEKTTPLFARALGL